MVSRIALPVLLLALFFLPATVGAAMYAYVDARGVCHYTNVPGNGRYKLSDTPPRRVGGSPEDQLINTITRRTNSGLARAEKSARVTSLGSIAGYFPYRTAPQTINRYIQLAAMNNQVDPLLLKAVIKAESNFDPNAISPKGAQGLMQLMPGTARDLQVSNPFDPLQNINGGAKYLRWLLDSYNGNLELSLAAYNAGPGNVTPKSGIPNFPETQNYVAKVMEHYQALRGSRYRPAPKSVPSNILVRQLVTTR